MEMATPLFASMEDDWLVISGFHGRADATTLNAGSEARPLQICGEFGMGAPGAPDAMYTSHNLEGCALEAVCQIKKPLGINQAT
jgi:hypothetical protein